MTKPKDFSGGDTGKDYCVYCARPDGSMQSYSEELKGTTELIMGTQCFDEKAARELTIRTIAKLPAWKGTALSEA